MSSKAKKRRKAEAAAPAATKGSSGVEIATAVKTDTLNKTALVTAIALLLIGIGGVVYFATDSAISGFQNQMLQSMQNWIFIAAHAFLCLIGLLALGFVRPRRR